MKKHKADQSMRQDAFEIIFKHMAEAVWLLFTDGAVLAANPAAASAGGRN